MARYLVTCMESYKPAALRKHECSSAVCIHILGNLNVNKRSRVLQGYGLHYNVNIYILQTQLET